MVSNENVATFIKELVLQTGPRQALDFKAGAYMQIDIPGYDAAFEEFEVAERYKPAWDRFDLLRLHAGQPVSPTYRAYSLANPPAEGDMLKFTIRIATRRPAASPTHRPGSAHPTSSTSSRATG